MICQVPILSLRELVFSYILRPCTVPKLCTSCLSIICFVLSFLNAVIIFGICMYDVHVTADALQIAMSLSTAAQFVCGRI